MSVGERLTVLGVGAHPSDTFANIGGTLANHARRGDRVVTLSLTYGVQHLSDKLIGRSVPEIKQIAREFTAEASDLMGFEEYRILDFGDSPLMSTEEKLLELGRVTREIRPDIIIDAHHPLSGVDHGESATMVERAPTYISHGAGTTAPKLGPTVTYQCVTDLIYAWSQPLSVAPAMYVDVTETIDLKVKAYTEIYMRYSSVDMRDQAKKIKTVHAYFGVGAGVEYAEPFVSSRRLPTVQCLPK